MKQLTERQMITILEQNKLSEILALYPNWEHRDQIMAFAFGEEFMESDNKGERVLMEECS